MTSGPKKRKRSAGRETNRRADLSHEQIYRQILDFKPRKADLRRMAILDAVIDCLAAKGTDWISSQEVGRLSKMARSHVVYYFPNQDAMLEGAIHFVVSVGQEITVAQVALGRTPEERLQAMVRATYAWFERYPKHAAVMAALNYLGIRSPQYRALGQRIREAGESRLETILTSAKARPGAGREQARFLARAIRAVIVGTLTHAFAATEEIDLDAAYRETLRAARELADLYWEKSSAQGR